MEMQKFVGVVGAGIVAGVSGVASATPIAPGGFISPLTDTTVIPGTIVQDVARSVSGNFTGVGNDPYEVQIRDVVIRGTDGTYDFYQQFTLVTKPTSAPLTVRRDGFDGFTTNVGYRTDLGGTAAPSNASRTGGAGDALSFDFGLGLPAGTVTRFVYVDTNAPWYAETATGRVDLSQAINNEAYASFTTFAPAVPEPASLAALALAGVAVRRRRK